MSAVAYDHNFVSDGGSKTLSNAALQTAESRRMRMQTVQAIYADRRRDRFYLTPSQSSVGAVFISDVESSQMLAPPEPFHGPAGPAFLFPQPIVPAGACSLTPFSTLGQAAPSQADVTPRGSSSSSLSAAGAPAMAAPSGAGTAFAPVLVAVDHASGSALPFATPPSPSRPAGRVTGGLLSSSSTGAGGAGGPLINDGGSGDPALDEVHARLMSLGLQTTFDPSQEPAGAASPAATAAAAAAAAAAATAAGGLVSSGSMLGDAGGPGSALAGVAAAAAIDPSAVPPLSAEAAAVAAAAGVSGGPTGQQVDPTSGAIMGKHVVQLQNRTSGVSNIDLSDPVSFAFRPAPRFATVQCYIARTKGGFSNLFHTSYECFLQADDTFILGCRKQTSSKTPQYSFTTARKTYDKRSVHYVGKLRSNFMGTEFMAYDYGLNPAKMEPAALARTQDMALAGEFKDTVRRTTPEADTPARREITGIAYESNVLSAKGPRKMTVVLPRVTYRAPRGVSAAAAAGNNSMVTVWRPVKPTETLFANYRATCTDSMMVLQNKPPKWNEQVGAYVLNFGGRVTMASVKNFQLMSPDDPDTVVLQFGRTGKDHFTMDFSWPLNLYQAFCICVSSLDNKLACE